MKPDRVVVGVDSQEAAQVIGELYAPFVRTGNPIIFMDVPSAEMTKYAANAMLATRISFMNQIARLCEAVGADVTHVRKGIGTDRRIGSAFLFPGPGYGGSCFPKDVKALMRTAEANGVSLDVVQAVEVSNERQKRVLFEKLQRHFDGNLDGQTIAVWGLAFKAETDDVRESPALVLVEELLCAGAKVGRGIPRLAPVRPVARAGPSRRGYGQLHHWVPRQRGPPAGAPRLSVRAARRYQLHRSPGAARRCAPLRQPRQPRGLPGAADSDPEGGLARHAQGAGACQGEARPVPARLHL